MLTGAASTPSRRQASHDGFLKTVNFAGRSTPTDVCVLRVATKSQVNVPVSTSGCTHWFVEINCSHGWFQATEQKKFSVRGRVGRWSLCSKMLLLPWRPWGGEPSPDPYPLHVTQPQCLYETNPDPKLLFRKSGRPIPLTTRLGCFFVLRGHFRPLCSTYTGCPCAPAGRIQVFLALRHPKPLFVRVVRVYSQWG